MAAYTVGSVPYLNAKPLVKPLIWAGNEAQVQVEFAVPSQLPPMLQSNHAQAIMVSSISALMDPDCTVAEGLSISTQTDVLSVRLFSKVPFHEIKTLAEDASSMTSNALAKILLLEHFGVVPSCFPQPPLGSAMLEECDACVLIGDNGMRFEGAGLYVMDLGRAWYELTQLPFVWAVWKGSDSLNSELVTSLQQSLKQSLNQMGRVIHEAAEETEFTVEQCRHYLLDIMDYRLTGSHLKGLAAFGTLLEKHGLLAKAFEPNIVRGSDSMLLV